jgi:phosphoribosylanthranilate isomerase
MTTFIKICGLSEQRHIEAAIKGGADAIGFVAYPPSPRFVTPGEVKELCSLIPNNILRVLVCVNMSQTEIQAYLDAGINCLQFHGNESADDAALYDCEIWRALRLKDKSQFEQEWSFPCSKFVVDSAPKNASLPGGTGHIADWNLAHDFIQGTETPVLIAGGIKAHNFADALNQTGAAGLDLSSGVEDSPGQKSLTKIQELMQAIKRY